MINKYKIHNIVEYIKLFDFSFEIDEVKENLNDIMVYFGFANTDLTTDEKQIVSSELIKLAEQFEFKEAAHLALQEDFLMV